VTTRNTSYPELRALALANEKMSNLFHWLRDQPECSEFSSRTDVLGFIDKFSVQDVLLAALSVRCDLGTGAGINFELSTEVRDALCIVEASVCVNLSEGDDQLAYRMFEVETPAEYAKVLGLAADELWTLREPCLKRAKERAL
jgi:hypothetical protein